MGRGCGGRGRKRAAVELWYEARVAISRRKSNASLRWHFTGGPEMLRTGGARMHAAQQQEHQMYIRCKLSQCSLEQRDTVFVRTLGGAAQCRDA